MNFKPIFTSKLKRKRSDNVIMQKIRHDNYRFGHKNEHISTIWLCWPLRTLDSEYYSCFPWRSYCITPPVLDARVPSTTKKQAQATLLKILCPLCATKREFFQHRTQNNRCACAFIHILHSSANYLVRLVCWNSEKCSFYFFNFYSVFFYSKHEMNIKFEWNRNMNVWNKVSKRKWKNQQKRRRRR